VRVFFILCLLLMCTGVSAQVVYKTVKADGRVVYSDMPSDGAVPVTLSSMNTVVVPALHHSANQSIRQSSQVKKRRPEVQHSVYFHYPEAEQTLRDNSGAVTISVDVLPKKSGNFQLVFDNRVVKTQTTGKFILESVNRGAHTIQVNFFDNSGKILASSKRQTFYLHKSSALINAN
jgi:hypothetical protein